MQLCAAVSSRGAVRQRKAKVKEAAQSSGFIILQQFLCRRCLVRLKGQVSPFPSSSYMTPGCARPLCRSRYPLCCLAMMPPTWSHTMCRNHVRRNPPGRGGELWLAPLPAPPWRHWGSAQPLCSLTELHGSANPLPTSCTHLGKICQKVTAQTNKTKQRISFATFLHVTFEFSSWQLFTSLPWLWLAEVMFRLQQEPRRTAAQKGLLQPPALIKPHGYASRTRALIQLPALGAGPTTPCWRGNPKNKPNWSISSKQLCQFSHETGNTRFYL